MILYKCKLPAAKDIRATYEIQYVEIESEYPLTDNTIRRMVIDKVSKEYISFGHITYEFELKRN